MKNCEQLKKTIYYHLRQWPIVKRMAILFCFGSMVPILFISSYLYYTTSHTLQKNINKIIVAENKQAASYISDKVRKVISDSVIISNMDLVKKLLLNYNSYNTVDKFLLTRHISTNMNNRNIYNDVVANIYLYLPDYQKIPLYNASNVIFKPSIEELDEMIAGLEDRSRGFFCYGSNSIVLLMKVFDDEESILGYLLVRVNESTIAEMYPDNESGQELHSMIVNSDGIIVSSVDKEQLSHNIKEYGIDLQKLKLDSRNNIASIQVEGKKKAVNYSEIQGIDWYIVSVVPWEFFLIDRKELWIAVFIMIGIFLLFTSGISLTISYSIIKPLNDLVGVMKHYEDKEKAISDIGNDEISYLIDNFYQMSNRLDLQMEEIIQNEREKKKLEIQTLQAQINPHFIANTLNMISNIAEVNDVPSITELSDSLVDLVRDSYRNEQGLISVSDEISMLKSYINIQDYRTMGKFMVNMQIDAEIMKYQIPHLLLQPFVENSILHGILPDKGKNGIISIRGYERAEQMYFEITDNGVGMSEEQITHLLNNQSNKDKGRFNSIGIYNSAERVRLLFGPEYGVTINSIPGLYTTVMIVLPKITKEQAENYA